MFWPNDPGNKLSLPEPVTMATGQAGKENREETNADLERHLPPLYLSLMEQFQLTPFEKVGRCDKVDGWGVKVSRFTDSNAMLKRLMFSIHVHSARMSAWRRRIQPQSASGAAPAVAGSMAALRVSGCRRLQSASQLPSHYFGWHFVTKQEICCWSNLLITS